MPARSPAEKLVLPKFKTDIPDKKAWFKMINEIQDPHYCEALIIQLEARKEQLECRFNSCTP